jgi:hypothetical protein
MQPSRPRFRALPVQCDMSEVGRENSIDFSRAVTFLYRSAARPNASRTIVHNMHCYCVLV